MQKRGRPSRFPPPTCKIPIVDAGLRVVGWTDEVPLIRAGELRHGEAEKLVGTPIEAIYIELENLRDAILAGAPSDWRGPWRCLGLANVTTAESIAQAKIFPLDRRVAPRNH